jgi:sugar phosphate isomerase/epimerase
MKIGYIGIIQGELEADPTGTLEWVAGLGFDGMEGAAAMAPRFGLGIVETRKKLNDLGLHAAPQGVVKLGQSDAEIGAVIESAREIGAEYVVQYYAPFDGSEEILRYTDFFNRVGKLCREEGLVFIYHNHDHEFKRYDGVYGLELMLANTDPELVKSELDVAWVTFGGADPAAFLRKYAGRCPVLHMKDFARLEPGCDRAVGNRREAVFAEVGTGVVDTKGVVRAAKECEVDWLVIEQDRMNTLTPRESLEVSYRNLARLVG